ncbi:MAG TPA: stage II sporulation protein M [Dehalococcoidia bacterium]|jgi:stage II sporulation protein M|nr:stage II sporulation protein M [Dehalococcoidia bacterium]
MSYKRWVWVAAGLFGLGMALGLAIPGGIADLMAQDLAALEELASILGPFQISTAIFIFLKNASALLFSFILSPLLCLIPILALTANGLLISFVSASIIQQKSLGFLLTGLLPHGIFELPAFIMGQAAALSFGTMAIIALLSRRRRNKLAANLRQNLRYLVLALMLLVPAAVIETYLTPLLLR